MSRVWAPSYSFISYYLHITTISIQVLSIYLNYYFLMAVNRNVVIRYGINMNHPAGRFGSEPVRREREGDNEGPEPPDRGRAYFLTQLANTKHRLRVDEREASLALSWVNVLASLFQQKLPLYYTGNIVAEINRLRLDLQWVRQQASAMAEEIHLRLVDSSEIARGGRSYYPGIITDPEQFWIDTVLPFMRKDFHNWKRYVGRIIWLYDSLLSRFNFTAQVDAHRSSVSQHYWTMLYRMGRSLGLLNGQDRYGFESFYRRSVNPSARPDNHEHMDSIVEHDDHGDSETDVDE